MKILSVNIPNISIVLKYHGSSDYALPSKREIIVYDKKLDIQIFKFFLDERTNELELEENGDISKFILYLFNKLKKSNVNYGNIGTDDPYQYEGTEHITISDFFEFIKEENRELIIKELLKK